MYQSRTSSTSQWKIPLIDESASAQISWAINLFQIAVCAFPFVDAAPRSNAVSEYKHRDLSDSDSLVTSLYAASDSALVNECYPT